MSGHHHPTTRRHNEGSGEKGEGRREREERQQERGRRHQEKETISEMEALSINCSSAEVTTNPDNDRQTIPTN